MYVDNIIYSVCVCMCVCVLSVRNIIPAKDLLLL